MNHIMTTSLNLHILLKNLFVILYGYTMSALFGYLNATSNKKMLQSISREYKILIKKDSNKSA